VEGVNLCDIVFSSKVLSIVKLQVVINYSYILCHTASVCKFHKQI
jgi:hypothetical protein